MSFGWKHTGWVSSHVFPYSTFVLFNPTFILLILVCQQSLISMNSILISLHMVFPIDEILSISFHFELRVATEEAVQASTF